MKTELRSLMTHVSQLMLDFFADAAHRIFRPSLNSGFVHFIRLIFRVSSSVTQVIEFLLWGSKLVRFLAKIKHTPRKLLYFVNRPNAKSSKSAKIILSKSIFYVKNQPIFFKEKFHLTISFQETIFLLFFFFISNFQTFYFLKLCPIFVDQTLGLFTKYNNFLGVC